MTTDACALPPFKVLAAALRKTTEHLARELVQPAASPPTWSELEWAIARPVAAMQGVTVLLAHTLGWPGPPSWQSFLAEQRAQAVRRDARIGELLERLDAATCAARIACVALKGAALRALGLYRPGERPMGDVDVLVTGQDLGAIAGVLRDLDYVEAYTLSRHAIFAPRLPTAIHELGEHVDNPLTIEVHTCVAERLPIRPVEITSRLRPASPRPGLNPYPSVAALLLHLMLHAAGNMLTHTLRQIQLHDIATLAARLGAADWETLLARHRAGEILWWAYPPLALAARYYPERIPLDVLSELRRACPRALRFTADRRTLTDVSWSNLRIHAFPGIAWSRTPLDALRYMRSRVLPTRAAREELRLTFEANPHHHRVPWYGISHAERIVRWLVSRPPRVQTIASVAAALDGSR